MRVTSNTSPLIALAKIGRLTLLKKLYGAIIISPFVKVESVDKGKALGASDALEIQKAIDEGWIVVAELNGKQGKVVDELFDVMRIGLGEAGALILAIDEKLMVILDDKEARAIAKSWDLQYTGTVMVLYEGYIRGLIAFDELVEDLSRLTKIMWISSDVIAQIINKARQVKK